MALFFLQLSRLRSHLAASSIAQDDDQDQDQDQEGEVRETQEQKEKYGVKEKGNASKGRGEPSLVFSISWFS